MKNLLTYLLQLFILLSIASLSTLSQGDKVSYELKTEKDVYYEQELIVIEIKVINNDINMASVSYNCSFEDDVLWGLNITDDLNSWYEYHYLCCYDCFSFPIKIKPREYYESYGTPLFYYGNKKSNFGYYYYYLSEGNYSLSFRSSDTAKFKVIKHENDDSFNVLTEIFGLKENKDKLIRLKEYLYEYSSSVYLDLAYGEFTKLMRYGNIDAFKKVMKYFFSRRSNSWSSDIYLFQSAHLIEVVEGKGKMFEFLDKLVKKCQGTRVGNIAEKIIKDKKIPDYVY